MTEVRWTLDELCEQVALVLAEDAPGTLDGRVREIPDRRTIRYYTTLGLLDRPAEMRGRTAYYDRKHLWQLLAVKRLQAKGLPLTQIQQALLGLSEEELRRLAGVPDEAPRRKRARRQEREAFWSATPAPAPGEPARSAGDGVPILQGVPLAPGVVLMVKALRDLRDEDGSALLQAAGPLLDLLRARGLIEDNTDSPSH
jgi:DNA-binding transcriptional MerR regulator